MILLKGLTKAFEEKVILDSADFCFEAGRFYCLTGESGCGKTTLLRLIAGLDCADAGEICCSERISYSFQESRLFPQLDALSNVAISCSSERARELLCKLGLEDALHKFPSELSGGMKQRVSVARAIGREADVYLFDEPTAALDHNSACICSNVIVSELREKTLIISTHSPALCEAADSVLKMANGRIV